MTFKLTFPLALACLVVVGCDRPDPGRQDQAASGLPPLGAIVESPDGERTWAGLLPCSDCQGIDTRLTLRSVEGRRDYVLNETYLGGKGKTQFNSAGAWVEVSAERGSERITLYVLDPEDAPQRFALQPDGALELLVGDSIAPTQAVANRLQRL